MEKGQLTFERSGTSMLTLAVAGIATVVKGTRETTGKRHDQMAKMTLW